MVGGGGGRLAGRLAAVRSARGFLASSDGERPAAASEEPSRAHGSCISR